MLLLNGNISEFVKSYEKWDLYVQWLEQYFKPNDIKDEGKNISVVLLSVVEGKPFIFYLYQPTYN